MVVGRGVYQGGLGGGRGGGLWRETLIIKCQQVSQTNKLSALLYCTYIYIHTYNSIYRVFIKYCVFSTISNYIPDSGLSRFCSVCTPDFMLGPLNDRQNTSAAAELAELRKITTFYVKKTIFNETLYMTDRPTKQTILVQPSNQLTDRPTSRPNN